MLGRIRADVQALLDDDDIDLATEAPAWVVWLRHTYEFLLLGAAVVSAVLIVRHDRVSEIVSWLIWAWFAIDYSVRLYVANDRSGYVRSHRLELLAALPVDVLRPLRLLRVLRPLAILVRSTKGMRDVLGLSGFTLIGSVGVCVVLVGGALLTWIEPETAPTFADGMWWSIVTTTTVGYGDISPATNGGRVVAGILMITGIGLLGAVTGEVAERMIRRAGPEGGEGAPAGTGHPEIDHLIRRLQGWPDLAAAERRRLADMLRLLADEGAGPEEEGTS